MRSMNLLYSLVVTKKVFRFVCLFFELVWNHVCEYRQLPIFCFQSLSSLYLLYIL